MLRRLSTSFLVLANQANSIDLRVADVSRQFVLRLGLRAIQGLSGFMYVCNVQVNEVDQGVARLGTGFGNALAAINAARLFADSFVGISAAPERIGDVGSISYAFHVR